MNLLIVATWIGILQSGSPIQSQSHWYLIIRQPKALFFVATIVLVQSEMERRRSPLVGIPPCGRGFSRHRGLSIR